MMGNTKSKSNNNEQILKKIIHDIRNSTTFSEEILHKINEMSFEERLQVLTEYNIMIDFYSSLFDEHK
jgi:hypothetical protein